MSDFDRRTLLKLAAASLVPWRHARAQDAPTRAADPVLVTIFLRGGQDALNVLVPHGDERYVELRPRIAIPARADEAGPGAIKLDGTFALHPSLAPLKSHWDAARLAFVVNVGSPHATRSHFDAQDFMEYAAPGSRTVRAGWLNRYLEATRKRRLPREGDLRAVAMQGLLPRALRGGFPVLAVPDDRVLKHEKALEEFERVYGGEMGGAPDPVVETGRETVETLRRYKAIVAKKSERKVAYPASSLGRKLRDVASVIHSGAGLELASLDVGGWDHHAREGGATGTIARMLEDLGASLAAFATDLGEAVFAKTLVLVMTEFGRTVRENGNEGTDHGHGGAMLLLGGAVKGGKVHGRWGGLEDRELYEGRDLPVTTDYRDVFASVLHGHLGHEPAKDFFPDYRPAAVKDLF